MDIQLNFINTTGDNVDVVIFQKNKQSFLPTAVAWRVLKNTSGGWATPLSFSTDFHVGAQDADGASLPRLTAKAGQKFIVEKTAKGMVLAAAGAASQPKEIQITNDLPDQNINAQIFKNEELLATINGGAPQQTAVFEFDETIWVGRVVGNEAVQGQLMSEGVVKSINTKISLTGIKSADLVMSEDKGVSDARGVVFTLENVVNT